MDEVYNWGYYMSHCGENYEKAEVWEQYFAEFARLLVDKLNPKTVLDVGCATGYLVAALRDLGVEAYGMDISAAAISRCRPDIRPYLQVHSLLDEDRPKGIPGKFDLVTNIEVLEHLYEDQTEQALQMLCSFSDHILFSSSPHDITEETHVNVRQPEYWVQMFAKQGLFRSDACDVSPVAPDAIYFVRKQELSLPRMVEDYEHRLRLLKTSWLAPAPSFVTAMVFDYGEGLAEDDCLLHTTVGKQLDWHLTLPAGVREIVLYPAHNARCIAENLVAGAGPNGLAVLDGRGQPLPAAAPLMLHNEPVYMKVSPVPEAPCSLHISGTIHVLTAGYLVGPLVSLRTQADRVPDLEARIRYFEEHTQNQDALIKFLREKVYHTELHASQLTEVRAALEAQYAAVTHSFSWKAGKPLRFALRAGRTLVKTLCRLPGLRRFYPWFTSVRHMGLHTVQFNQKHYGTLEGPRSAAIPPQAELEAQEQTAFPPLLFSLVTPLYNTPEPYLRELIQSLKGQTYSQWELCFADGSDDAHAYVGQVVGEYAKKDPRIRYQKLESNLGIAGNTNAALAMCTGDYVGMLDHDDLLNLNALFEMRRAIAEQQADFLYSDEITFCDDDLSRVTVQHHKPDYAPDTLRSNNYICHFTVFRRDLLEKAGGGYNPEFDGSQDYDMVLRMTEKAEKIVHIPEILYFWRSHQNSVASSASAKPYAIDAAQRAIAAHLARLGLAGTVEVAPGLESMYRIRYAIEGQPLVSILIPNKDEADTLTTCIQSILEKSTWQNFEILVVENGSTQHRTFTRYAQLKKDPRVRIMTWDKEFNYSAINNFAAARAKGEYLLLLNNDTEVIAPGWIEEMLMFAQRPDVGAVGAKLYYPDDTLQHAGVVIGMQGLAAHWQMGIARRNVGYMGNVNFARNVSCITAACLMMRRALYEELGGFSEQFTVAFNDVDLCMRIRQAGYLITYTPFAELYHHESKTRGPDTTPERMERHKSEVARFEHRWMPELAAGDPYYNKNLAQDTTDLAFVKPLMHV